MLTKWNFSYLWTWRKNFLRSVSSARHFWKNSKNSLNPIELEPSRSSFLNKLFVYARISESFNWRPSERMHLATSLRSKLKEPSSSNLRTTSLAFSLLKGYLFTNAGDFKYSIHANLVENPTWAGPNHSSYWLYLPGHLVIAWRQPLSARVFCIIIRSDKLLILPG